MAERKALVMKAGRKTVVPDTESIFGQRKINLGGSTLTIAAGVITRTSGYHKVETEGGAADDDLATINGGANGDILILSPENNAHTVTVKNGTGNITIGGGDHIMGDIEDTLVLLCLGASWIALELQQN